MKTIFTSLLIFGITIGLRAQKNTVRVELIHDDPEDINVVKARIPLWEPSMATYNLSLYDLNLGIAGVFNKFMVTADYSLSVFDRIYPDSYEGNMEGNTVSQMIMFPFYESRPANYFECMGTWFFSNQVVKDDIKITLSAGSNYEKYTMIPGHKLRRMGARIGFKKGVTWYAMNGATISATNVASGAAMNFSYNLQSTNMLYTNLSIGFAYSNTTNMTVMAEGFGQRTNSGIGIFYTDILISMNNTVDNVYAATSYDGTVGTMYYEEFNINDSNDKSKVGLRLGYQSIPFKRMIGFKIEGGIIPGLKAAKNIFFNFGVSLYFGNKPV